MKHQSKVDRNIPTNSEGVDGDRKVVKEGNDNYLYVKVDGRWMKTQLQEVVRWHHKNN